MKNSRYIFFKFLFGLFIIFLGIRSFLDLEENKTQMVKSLEKYEVDMNYLFDKFKIYFTHNYEEAKDFYFFQHAINLHKLKEITQEILLVSSSLTILGGLLCVYGYSMSFALIFFGFLIEFIFIHNFYYFKEEKMKVNVLKLISVFGGLLHL